MTYRAASGKTEALDSLDLQVEAGQAISIVGPSGCGKSTTLRLAAGLLQPTQGSVSYDGAPAEQPRQKTALILQDFGLLPWKTVLDNAALGLQIRGVARSERRQTAREALKTVGLSDFQTHFPNQLSGGMKQRLALARALALDVDTLLMDEPLSALDAMLREQLQDTLLEQWQRNGYTQVLVTHSIEEAVYLGQRIVIMQSRPGRVTAVVDNPEMGTPHHREQDAFFARCKQLRAIIAQHAEAAQAAATEEGGA